MNFQVEFVIIDNCVTESCLLLNVFRVKNTIAPLNGEAILVSVYSLHPIFRVGRPSDMLSALGSLVFRTVEMSGGQSMTKEESSAVRRKPLRLSFRSTTRPHSFDCFNSSLLVFYSLSKHELFHF